MTLLHAFMVVNIVVAAVNGVQPFEFLLTCKTLAATIEFGPGQD